MVVVALMLKVVLLSPSSHFDKSFSKFHGSNKSHDVGKKSAMFLS